MRVNVIEEMTGITFRQCKSLTEMTEEYAHGLFVIAGGMGNLMIRHVKFPVSMGKCYYAPPGTKVTAMPHFNSLDLYHIAFERLRGPEGNERLWRADNSSFAPEGELFAGDDGRLLELVNSLYNNGEDREELSVYRQRKLFHELVFEVIQTYAAHSEEQTNSHAAIKRTIQYLQEHYNEELGRDELAKMANLSPEYYSQQFRAISGSSLTDYLAMLRIQHVKEKLLFTQERLAKIAKAVGYRDEYYLSRKFKKVTGLSPSAYIKSDKKVVSLNPHLTRHLLALGIVPAATLSFPWKFGTYQEQLDQSGCLCREWDKGFADEELRQLKPDLLLCIDNVSADRLSFYRSICPTLVVPWYVSDWRGHFRSVAKAVGKQVAAENWLAEFQSKVMEARAVIRATIDEEMTVLIYNVRESTSFIYRDRGMGSQVIYDELHLRMPESVRAKMIHDTSIPLEPDHLLPTYAADCMLLSVEASKKAEERARAMLETAQWNTYLSSSRQRIHKVDMAQWHGYDPLSIEWQLEEAVRLFTLRESK